MILESCKINMNSLGIIIIFLFNYFKYSSSYLYNSNFWRNRHGYSNLKWNPVNFDESTAYKQYIQNVNSNNYFKLDGYKTKSIFRKLIFIPNNETGILEQEGEISMYD